MTSEAIVIGVNYQSQDAFLQPLKYAEQDALAVKQFLENEARFDRVYYFAEDAPAVNGMSMRPTRNNLRRVMRETFKHPFMSDGDNFWFFFSGHGMRWGERDFLMPIDGDPEDVAESGISTAQVSEWLRGCGADNVVMVLDACRSGGMKDGKGIGDETREGCRQTGVISLFSCSPNQFSYELEVHQQGAFTKVLLEGLGVQGGCATVARLDEYLKRRVPEVVREALGDRYSQMPYSIAEPIHKVHHILLPNLPYSEDDRSIFDENVKTLKMDAFRAQVSGDLRLAYQCWLRVNIVSGGRDRDAIGEIAKLYPQIMLWGTQISRQTISKLSSNVSFTKGDLERSIAEEETKQSVSLQDQKLLFDLQNVPLESVRNIDYSKLRDLLQVRRWKEADQETLKIMARFLDNLREFPSKYLKTINLLWLVASNGHFGFSVQRKIWEEQMKSKAPEDPWNRFYIEVGWQTKHSNRYVNYNDLKFSEQTSNIGELPVCGGAIGGVLAERYTALFRIPLSKSLPPTIPRE